ncbi:MAG: hypothetical protein ACR2NZ_21780, partial [Rubripirellula sp.]
MNQSRLESLQHDVCAAVRESVEQPFLAVVQCAHRRLGQDAADNEAICVIAFSRLQDDSPESCLELLQRGSLSSEGHPLGSRLAGYAHLALGNLSAAQIAFDDSVRADPCQEDCWTLLGRIHCQQGQEDRAVACFENATLFGVEQSEPALALAALYRNQRKLSEAIHTLRVALTENRRSAKLNLALAGLLRRRACVLDRRRMPLARRKVLDEARRCYVTALEVEPTADACLQFGIFEQAMGHHEA